MVQLAGLGITHVVSLQTSFDDNKIAEGTGVSVLWCPFKDELAIKDPELSESVARFSLDACQQPNSKVFIHCEHSIRRIPMMLLAILGVLDMKLSVAMELIQKARPRVEFLAAYRQSIVRFVAAYRDRIRA